MYNIFFQPVKALIPMKETAEKALKRLGIHVLRDLVFYKPISYNISNTSSDFTKFQDGMLVQVDVNVDEITKPTFHRSPTKIYTSNSSISFVN